MDSGTIAEPAFCRMSDDAGARRHGWAWRDFSNGTQENLLSVAPEVQKERSEDHGMRVDVPRSLPSNPETETALPGWLVLKCRVSYLSCCWFSLIPAPNNMQPAECLCPLFSFPAAKA